jgi:DNA-binding NarL/FixJ family response regulator
VAAFEPAYRLGLAAVLGDAAVVVDAVGSVGAGHDALLRLRPRQAVLVLDPALPDATLEVACRVLVTGHPCVATLVLLRRPDAAQVRLAYQHGARGVFGTEVEPAVLRDALLQIAAGEMAVQPNLVRHLVHWSGSEAVAPAATNPLSEREQAALRLLAEGQSTKEIAARLAVTPKAVNHAIDRAVRRLGAAHRTHATVVAVQRGLLG